MRPRAVWRAHEKAILGIQGWGSDKIITQVLNVFLEGGSCLLMRNLVMVAILNSLFGN